MMKNEMRLENLPHNGNEAKIVKVHKQQGDTVEPDDVVFDVESGKGSVSVATDIKGTIEEIMVSAGDTVKVNSVLAVISGEKKVQKSSGTGYFDGLLKPQKQTLDADITIIGGGPGGYVAAIHAAKLGAKVIVVEKEKLGGTCLNWGCIPTKALVRCAQVLNTLKNAGEFGCDAKNISFDMKKIIDRKNGIVTKLVTGIKYLMEKHQIKVINGVGNIVDPQTVYAKSATHETTIKTKNIIVATGSVSAKLPVPGIDNKNVISSNEALELTNLPKKMIIIGGGVIGMEFAFLYAQFGVNVSVVEYFDQCVTACDDDVIAENAKNAAAKGIQLYNGAKVEEILETTDGKPIILFEKNGEKNYISADLVLVAVGRTPYTQGLGIEEAGIELNDNKKGIKVNPKMQTTTPNIYAIGDVTNTIMLAHVASHQGIVAVNNIMGIESEMDYAAVPSAIFTEPEIAIVGLSEKEAIKRGLDIQIGKFPYGANGKALTFGESSGFIKLIKDSGSNKLIGASIIGLHATDLIAELTLAIKNNLSPEAIIETIHAHPTTAEVIHEGALAVEGGAIHFA